MLSTIYLSNMHATLNLPVKLLNLDSCLKICNMYWMAFVPAVNISHKIMPNDQTSVLKVMRKLSVLP